MIRWPWGKPAKASPDDWPEWIFNDNGTITPRDTTPGGILLMPTGYGVGSVVVPRRDCTISQSV